jgi:hypothetical protein
MAPLTFGFPFGLTLGGVNVPLPAKLVTQVLPPIDIRDRFGISPDIDEVDTHVRTVMQAELNRLVAQRRVPFLG